MRLFREFGEDFVAWYDWFERQPFSRALNTIRYLEQRNVALGGREAVALRALVGTLLAMIACLALGLPSYLTAIAFVLLCATGCYLCAIVSRNSPFAGLLLFVQLGAPLLIAAVGYAYYLLELDGRLIS
jgi:hypothetical protein